MVSFSITKHDTSNVILCALLFYVDHLPIEFVSLFSRPRLLTLTGFSMVFSSINALCSCEFSTCLFSCTVYRTSCTKNLFDPNDCNNKFNDKMYSNTIVSNVRNSPHKRILEGYNHFFNH